MMDDTEAVVAAAKSSALRWALAGFLLGGTIAASLIIWGLYFA